MTYRLTGQADVDLFTMYLEGLETFGLIQADRYYDDIKRVIALIGANPSMARERKEIMPPVRIHPHAEHLIVYDIDDEGVIILRVRHCRENWEDDPLGV